MATTTAATTTTTGTTTANAKAGNVQVAAKGKLFGCLVEVGYFKDDSGSMVIATGQTDPAIGAYTVSQMCTDLGLGEDALTKALPDGLAQGIGSIGVAVNTLYYAKISRPASAAVVKAAVTAASASEYAVDVEIRAEKLFSSMGIDALEITKVGVKAWNTSNATVLAKMGITEMITLRDAVKASLSLPTTTTAAAAA